VTYATLSDLTDRAGETELRQIADRDRDGVPDAGVIAAALADARDAIDGYIGAKYALPLADVPPLVRVWAVSIARYILHRNGAPDHVAQDYKDAIAALKDVSRGLITLPVAQGDAAPAPGASEVLAAHPAPVFTPERLRGW
jgi:phage gp36-like protein